MTKFHNHILWFDALEQTINSTMMVDETIKDLFGRLLRYNSPCHLTIDYPY